MTVEKTVSKKKLESIVKKFRALRNDFSERMTDASWYEDEARMEALLTENRSALEQLLYEVERLIS